MSADFSRDELLRMLASIEEERRRTGERIRELEARNAELTAERDAARRPSDSRAGVDGSPLPTALVDPAPAKRTEHELGLANDRLSKELEVMNRLHALATLSISDDMPDVLAAVVDAALSIAAADSATVHLLDLRSGELRIQGHQGLDPLLLARLSTVQPGEATCGSAFTSGGLVSIDDAATSPTIEASERAALLGSALRAIRSTALQTRNGLAFGVLSVYHRDPQRTDAHTTRGLELLARLSADLLEKRHLMDELRETEQRTRDFLAGIADPVVIVDETELIVYANVKAEKVFGYGEGELLRRPLDILVPDRFRASHVAHARRFFDVEPRSRPMGSGLELFARRKEGTEFPIEASLSPLTTRSGRMVCSVVRDISDRRRLEVEARLHSQRLASAIESIPDAVAVWDAGGELIACNPAYQELVAELGADHAPPFGTVELHLPTGRRLRSTAREMPGGGKVVAAVDLTEEMTHRIALETATAKAEAASHAKSEFLASMSHELRTPLNAVLGFSQLLQRDRREPLTERQRGMVDQVYRSGEQLLHLIDDVLDLARIEANRIAISLEPVSAVDAIQTAREALELTATEAGVAMTFDPPAAEVPSILADPRRLGQILINFASNAIKYHKPGGRVVFEAAAIGTTVRLSVRDDGPGIPPDRQGGLFRPFERAGQETGPVEGTGIGLAISKQLAELMHGQVGFESGPAGSTFWVDLPTDVGRNVGRAGPRSLPPPEARPLSVRRATVLYLEDNLSSVSFMRAFFGGVDGVDLVVAPDAERGLSIVRERRPDLILMDVNLPGMSGLDALAVLQAAPATRDIPVIALSAVAGEGARSLGRSAGFRRYLTKPVRVEQLEELLETFLHRRP